MNFLKKISCICCFILFFIILGTVTSNAGNLSLDNLNFDVQVNSDGSMDVTEVWNIRVNDTNTLYKSFKYDNTKYSDITNVSVKDITSSNIQDYTETYTWAYHVTKGYFYGTENKNGDFEIGWGVGLEGKTANKVYEIKYTVENAITKYNDYAELYWQFVGSDFEVSSKKISGTIYLPEHANNKEDIKVWGHTEGLNGTIYVTDTNKIEFEINNFRSGRFVEIRTLFPSDMILYSERDYNKDVLQSVINEESKWVNEANAKRLRKATSIWLAVAVIVVINIILVVIYVKKMLKYMSILKKEKKYIPSISLKYFRDIPDENASPGEAKILMDDEFISYSPESFGKVFSATILNLTLKKYIEIQENLSNSKKEKIVITILDKQQDELPEDEKIIYKYIKDIANGREKITIKDLQKGISQKPERTKKLVENAHEKALNTLLINDKIDNNKKDEYEKYSGKMIAYIILGIFLACFTFGTLFSVAIFLIINGVLCYKIMKNVNVLTKYGVDKKEEWKGLKNFMEDFSMLDKKEVPELVLWEKYLVYATAFGVADKVIKQLKVVYPNIDDMGNISTGTYMVLMMNTDFNTAFANSIGSAMSSAYSSATGGGGGFSGGGGGGGGRRWRRWKIIHLS